MHKAGVLDDQQLVNRVSRDLSQRGLDHQVREYDGRFEIWVYDERTLTTAHELIETWRQNPRYPPPPFPAERRNRNEIATPRSPQVRILRGLQFAPLTLSLVLISVLVFVLSFTPFQEGVFSNLLISNQASNHHLPEISRGQIWRLLTPIFLHFHILHILFNMLWLYQLGTLIERKESTHLLLFQVASIGVGSNLAQWWISGPGFGGMSGVVYGLFGYLWIRSQHDPWSGYYVHSGVVYLMLAWLVLCFSGVLGPIANAAHVGGLVLGGVWALAVSNRPRKRAPR
ncbi:MAG: rhomboid family intramembrane serine protease [Gammaproteobacteria bacterium]